MIISYKYRIYPTKKQVDVINHQFSLCRRLYNNALEHRITAYKSAGISISYKDQQNELPLLKGAFPEYKTIHSQVLQNVLRRLDNSFCHFFRRVGEGQTPGFPRFKGKDFFNSICYTQSGFALVGNRVELSKIGEVKIKLHRKMEGKIKTCSIKRSGKQWYIIFTCEVIKIIDKRPIWSITGIDLGLESFATLSSGEKIDNPRYLKKNEEKLKDMQSVYSLKKSKNKKKKLVRLHKKVTNQRNVFLHKMSRSLVNRFDLIAYEELDIRQMIPGRFAKSIQDAGWGKFIQIIKYKAESAGTCAIGVNPRNTSQTCSHCGVAVKKEIHQRIHECPGCGLSLHRDHNAAINILKSGTDAVFQMPRQLAAG